MTELRQFCETRGIDPDKAAAALARERQLEMSALSMPWFARAVVGAGAWVTALAAIGAGSVFLFLLIGTETVGTLAILGAGFLALGLWVIRGEGIGAFAEQLGTAIAAAGVAMIAIGFGMETRMIWVAAIVAVAVTAIVVTATPKRTLQFLSAALAAVLLAIALVDERIPYYLDVAALAGPIGVFLMLRPPRTDLQPSAVVLLLLFPLFGIFGAMDMSAWPDLPPAGGWFAKVLHIGLFLWLVSLHWQHAGPAARTRLAYVAAPAVALCLVLPAGGSAALVVMMLAFVIGSRPLALLGSLLQIHYIWRFYYDIDASLLVKSGILAGAGVLLLLAWWFVARQSQPEVRS